MATYIQCSLGKVDGSLMQKLLCVCVCVEVDYGIWPA